MDLKEFESCATQRSQMSRRTFVQAMATAVAVVGLSSSFPVLAADDTARRFKRASEFLTNRKLDPILAERFYAALKQRNPQFDADVAKLLSRIDQSKAADMDAFLASAALDPEAEATVSKIISAWYMGVVGEGADAQLISFADALMYQPTRGILVVPSYGGGPNSWGEKPV